MRYILAILSILCVKCIQAQTVQVIPQPVSIKTGVGSYQINSKTVLVVSNGVDDNTADFFNIYIKQLYGSR